MLHCVVGLLIPLVLKEFLYLSILVHKGSILLDMSGINNPITRCNVPEELNLQQQHWKQQLAHLTWIFLFLGQHSNLKINLTNLLSC